MGKDEILDEVVMLFGSFKQGETRVCNKCYRTLFSLVAQMKERDTAPERQSDLAMRW